jgi:mRNA interferase MazF
VDRGEVWWARLPPPIGTRPVLLLSRSQAYRVRRSVTATLITTTVRHIPVEVALGPEDGLPRPCVVNCDELHTIAITLIDNQIGALSEAKMQAVAEAVRFALDIECE